MDIPDSSWGEKCQEKLVLSHQVLQPMLCYRDLDSLSGSQSSVPKWRETPNDAGRLSNTQRFGWFWKSANTVQFTFLEDFLSFLTSLAVFHGCCFLAFTSGKTSLPSLRWTESNLNHICAMRSHPWDWMPLPWGIQQLQNCILCPWLFEHNAKRKT